MSGGILNHPVWVGDCPPAEEGVEVVVAVVVGAVVDVVVVAAVVQ